jgi:hypothetical protein
LRDDSQPKTKIVVLSAVWLSADCYISQVAVFKTYPAKLTYKTGAIARVKHFCLKRANFLSLLDKVSAKTNVRLQKLYQIPYWV